MSGMIERIEAEAIVHRYQGWIDWLAKKPLEGA